MLSETEERTARRPGGRSARVRRAVLDATGALIAELGYQGLSVEAVAQRAGVHKTTVYRRWPTKSDLVFELVQDRSAQNVRVPDTGNLERDLEIFALGILANISSEVGNRLVKTVVAAAADAPEVASLSHEFWRERLSLAATMVERAISRGEVPAGTDSNLILEALVAPLYLRLLITGEPINKRFATRLARLVAAAARAPSSKPMQRGRARAQASAPTSVT